MEEQHQNLNNPIYGALKNTQAREEEEEETVNLQRDLSCYYGLRENPKKTHKSFGLESPESMKKILFRCQECGKGFRYEKCLLNHQAGVHLSTNQRVYEESLKSLCSSFSLVKKKKRSRVIRYKKTTLSCSFTTFPESRSVFAAIDEELEVAECLILLSMSSPKFVDGLKHVSEAMDANTETPRGSYDSGCFRNKKPRKVGEFESEVMSNDQKLVNEEIRTDDSYKGPARFLRHECDLDQQKLKGGNFGNGFLSTELGVGAMECSDSDTEMVTESNKKNDEQHQCRLCNKIFSSYQALGGHQTFHRMSRSKNKKNCREKPVEELEDDSVTVIVTKEKKRYKCNICSKLFSSVHALGGHKKSHGSKRQHLQTEDHVDLGLLGVVPDTLGIELY